MSRLLNISRGDGGVHASAPVQVVYEEILSVYDEFQKQLEPSAYVGHDEKGRRFRELFPQTNKVDVCKEIRDRFSEIKKRYVSIQTQETNKRSDLKKRYFSKTFDKKVDKATFFHAETHCWQNSTNDKKVQKFTEVMEQICKLTTLRENFETQLKIYCHARHGLENAVKKIEMII